MRIPSGDPRRDRLLVEFPCRREFDREISSFWRSSTLPGVDLLSDSNVALTNSLHVRGREIFSPGTEFIHRWLGIPVP